MASAPPVVAKHVSSQRVILAPKASQIRLAIPAWECARILVGPTVGGDDLGLLGADELDEASNESKCSGTSNSTRGDAVDHEESPDEEGEEYFDLMTQVVLAGL